MFNSKMFVISDLKRRMGKIRSYRRTRRSIDALFKKECGCNLHEDSNEYNPLFNSDGKTFRKPLKQWLIDNKHLSALATYVCKACLDIADGYLKKKQSEDEMLAINDYQHIDIDDESASKILQNELTNKIIDMINDRYEENVQKLCLAIGQKLSKHVFADSKTCPSLYRDLDKLPDLDCKNFLKDGPKSLLTFLTSVSGVDFETCKQKRLNALCLLVEQLYYVRNMNFIGAFSFSQNSVRWSLAGSKTLQTIDGASTAAGSVTSLKKVLKMQLVNLMRALKKEM